MSRDYPAHPMVGAGVVVLRPGAVLLVRRNRPPALGQWSIPGGAQELGETVEDAARRELLEETGLAVGGLHLAGHVDSIHRDASGQVQYHYTILDFAAAWQEGEPVAGDDVGEARFFGFADLAGMGLWHETLRMIASARRLLAV